MTRAAFTLAIVGLLALSSATARAQNIDCRIQANQGQAACRDIINNGPTPDQLTALIAGATAPLQELNEQLRTQFTALQARFDVNDNALITFFTIVQGADVPAGARLQRLVEIAQRYKDLLAQAGSAPGDDPAVARLKDEAKAVLDTGGPDSLDRADALLAEAQAAEDADLDRRQRAAASTAAQRAQIALTQLRYNDAAAQFAAAAARLPADDPGALTYLDQEADALYRQGLEFGDNAALARAIDRYHRLLDLRPRATSAADWAQTQNGLGDALQALGERESGTTRLEEAVAAYRAALQERTRERAPLAWAETQSNLGAALQTLGSRESGTGRLEESVDAYHAALTERTRDRVPLDWAATQNNLGLALWTIGARESGTARLEESVDAYHAALEERTRALVPLDWAATQNNLGLALWTLGLRESGTARLEEAVAAFHAALEERTRKREPLDWARTETSLGRALETLGEREGGTARLEEALAAFRAGLEEETRARASLAWALNQDGLGDTLGILGERNGDPGSVAEAVTAISSARAVYIDEAGLTQYASYFDERLATLQSLREKLLEARQANASRNQ